MAGARFGTMVLKPMELDDTGFVTACIEEAVMLSVPGDDAADSKDWMPSLMDRASSILEAGESEIFILWDEGIRQGLVWVGQGSDYYTGRPIGFLYALHVSENARGRGLGRWLVSFAEDWCRLRGLDRLSLNVGAYNTNAEKVYRRLGFSPASMVMSKRLR